MTLILLTVRAMVEVKNNLKYIFSLVINSSFNTTCQPWGDPPTWLNPYPYPYLLQTHTYRKGKGLSWVGCG